MVISDLPVDSPLEALDSLANSHAENLGENNFVFKFRGDEFKIEESNKDERLVDVLDGDSREFEIECQEIKASGNHKKEIILKNATNRNLKIEAGYPKGF